MEAVAVATADILQKSSLHLLELHLRHQHLNSRINFRALYEGGLSDEELMPLVEKYGLII